MAIDKGGARRWEEEREHRINLPGFPIEAMPKRRLATYVRVEVHETHDGADCECIDSEITLRVGDTLELSHTCNDGRLDKVIAKVVEIAVAEPEHGLAQVVKRRDES